MYVLINSALGDHNDVLKSENRLGSAILALPVAAVDGRRSSQAVTLVMSLHYVHAVIDAGHVHNAHSLSCRVAYS